MKTHSVLRFVRDSFHTCCVIGIGCVIGAAYGCGPSSDSQDVTARVSQVEHSPIGTEVKTETVPQDLQKGEVHFHTFCARCHGQFGRGTTTGPPLVHKIYEPNHHGDFAFIRAATHGVRAHHWKFGNMPKIEGVTADHLTEIIQYIRWMQRQAGIY